MKTLAFFPPTPSSLAVVLLRFYSDSCHLPPSRLTDRWMCATSGATGLSSTTPVNPNTHALVNPRNILYRHAYDFHANTHLCLQPHTQTSQNPQGHPVKSSSSSLPVSMCCGDFEICFFFVFPSSLCSLFSLNTDVGLSYHSIPQCLLFTLSVNVCQPWAALTFFSCFFCLCEKLKKMLFCIIAFLYLLFLSSDSLE